ncbi:MAG: thymidylate synthase [Minisyncoccia bacterium]
MENFYKPLAERTPDTQYSDRLRYTLENGEMVTDTPQGVPALTCFGTLAPMVFNPSNGATIITERSMLGFWKKPICELIAFINGEHTIDGVESYGCKGYWEAYRGKGVNLGLDPDDLGPGSYGPAFHDFPVPRPWWNFWGRKKLNQFEQVIEQIQNYPTLRTLRVTPWIPYYTARGPYRKVQVAPCHGELHFRIMNGKLHMRMDKRSGDLPVGDPSNMIQYSALHLMMCQVTGYQPGNYIYSFSDAHIYEDQIPQVRKLLERKPRPFPILRLDPMVTNLFDFRAEHFTLEEYDPHPSMKIPYSP